MTDRFLHPNVMTVASSHLLNAWGRELGYDGNHPLSFTTSEYRQEFSSMLRGVSDNWMALVVDAVEERLHVEGFRMGDQPAGDAEAWNRE